MTPTPSPHPGTSLASPLGAGVPSDLDRLDPDATLAHAGRLQALRKTGLLDTGAEESFDRLTALAARLIGVPTVLISLVDQGRDFLKSRFGLPPALASLTELPGRTFCQFAIGLRTPLVIDDTRQRPELLEIDAVERFGVRAYAGVPLIDDEGHAIGAFCAVDFAPRAWTERDLDILGELAHATMREIKLRTALIEARELLTSREEMMAVVAHDLRTPLNVVTMYAQLLARETLPDKATHMVERLRRTANGMGELIKSLLDMSQIEAGSLVLMRQDVAPEALVRDAVKQHVADADREGVSLVTQFGADLPPVSVDYERIVRALDSLLANALKFSKHGATVTVSAQRVEGGVRFAVKDTGDGIAADELQGLLSRFWQVKLHERRGAGFGLAIASGLVGAHGGTMEAQSTLGAGSEFGFVIPLAS